MGGLLPPLGKTKVLCPLCSQWHRGTPHARLVRCSAWSPVFLREWVRTWGPWEDMAQRWLDQASPEDLDHISKLRVPQSFIDTVPREKLREVRYRVEWHPYHMMHATTLLRQSLPMPPRTHGIRSNADSRGTPLWYTKLRRPVVYLNPTVPRYGRRYTSNHGREGATSGVPSDRGLPLTPVRHTSCSNPTLTARPVRSFVSSPL